MSAEDVQQLRAQLLEELEAPYKGRLHELEQESNKYRDMHTELRRQHELMREEYEHKMKHGDGFQKEMEALRQAEVAELKSRVEVLTLQANDPGVAAQTRRLKRERTELELRSMSLSAELHEVHAQKKTASLENEQAQRLAMRQANELKTQVKALTGEAASLRLQLARMQEEAVTTQRTHDKLRDELHAAEKANIVVRGDKEDEIHGLRNEIRELQAGAMKFRSVAEREHKLLQEGQERAHNQVEVLERALQSATATLAQKDRDASNQVHAAREEEWAKYRCVRRVGGAG